MSPPWMLPLMAFMQRLRFPTLFKITAVLAAISWLWPFDPIPFIDEIVTALAMLLLASWKKREPSPAAGKTDSP